MRVVASALLSAASMQISKKLALVSILIASSAAAAPVVGGTKVPKGKWPDAVVVWNENSRCTGTLIAPDVVLTAGHCVDAHPVEVVVDTLDANSSTTGERIPVKSSRAYPSWESRYDVGVLVLEHAAKPSPRAIAAKCTADDLLVADGNVHVVGFGLATAAGNDQNGMLRETDLAVIDPACTMDADCNTAIAPDGEFMAGGNGHDACFGDSGGPVYLDTPKGPALIGVVSRGLALPGAPCGNGGIFVRADKVAAWIHSVTGAKLARTTCTGAADGEDPAEVTDDGGCSTGTGVGLAGGLLALAIFRLRRRRR
jgi:secreted trypsin-like serine protease